MRTLVLRIKFLDGDHYPVELCVEAEGQPDWLTMPVAEGSLPAALDDPPPPVHPDDDAPLDREAVREFLLTTSTQSDTFCEIGAWLFGLLTGNPAGQRWWELHADDVPSRTVLEIEPSELQALPWELLFDAASQKRPFASVTNPVLRGPVNFEAQQDLAWPVRVLIVFGADPADDKIDAADELREIQRTQPAFDGRLDIEILDRPSRAELFEVLDDYRPGILHFVGHGGVHDGQPILEFQDGDGDKWRFKTEDVANHFQEWCPRLVLLNACRSAAGVADAAIADGINSFESAFLDRGVAGVLAMQGDIRGDAAKLLSGLFYEALAEGRTVDAAVAEARLRLGDENTLGWRRREWCLPCLRLAEPAEQLLPSLAAVPQDRRDDICYSSEFQEIRPFVDRALERRSLQRIADLDRPDHRPRSLMAVVGPDHLGKTWLVYWMLRQWAWEGKRLAYVNLDGTDRMLFLDVLRRIIDCGDCSPILKGLEPAAFYRFNHALGAYLQGREPEPYVGGTILDVPAGKLTAGGEHVIAQIFSAFREALQESAAGDDTVLVLDHVSSVAGDQFQKYICENLLLPIARKHLAPVRALVVLTEQQHRDKLLWPDRLNQLTRVVEVTRFDREDFVRIATEFCIRSGREPNEDEMAFITALGTAGVTGPWGPDKFSIIRQALGL